MPRRKPPHSTVDTENPPQEPPLASGPVDGQSKEALRKRAPNSEAPGRPLAEEPAAHNGVRHARPHGSTEEREARFCGLMDLAADSFFLVGLDGKIVDANQRACDSLGYSRDELRSMSLADIDLDVERNDHKGRYWLFYNRFGGSGKSPADIRELKTLDLPASGLEHPEDPWAVFDKDGVCHLVSADFSGGIYYTRSKDMRSWSQPVLLVEKEKGISLGCPQLLLGEDDRGTLIYETGRGVFLLPVDLDASLPERIGKRRPSDQVKEFPIRWFQLPHTHGTRQEEYPLPATHRNPNGKRDGTRLPSAFAPPRRHVAGAASPGSMLPPVQNSASQQEGHG